MQSLLDRVDRQQDLTVIRAQQHRHTLLWLHGLNEHPEKYHEHLLAALGEHRDSTKVVMPRAPERYCTMLKDKASSWFDVKFRGADSFVVPFDQAFSAQEVNDSFEKYRANHLECCCRSSRARATWCAREGASSSSLAFRRAAA
jgi:hypothetical protein